VTHASTPRRRAVAINGKWLAQAPTGTQRYAAELVRRLVRADPTAYEVLLPKGATVPVWLPDEVGLRRAPLSGNAFEQLWLPWAVRGRVVLSLCGPAPLLARRNVAAIHDASVFRFPSTYTWAFRTWHRSMSRVLAHRARALVTVSRFSAGELATVLGVAPGRFRVVPDGADHLVDVSPRRPDLAGLDAPFVLCVGTPAVHKNLGPALAALGAAGIPTIVVGARAGRVFAGAETGPSGPSGPGPITYAGRLTDEELAWLYGQAEALVFPSRYEGFGVPVVEAQRAGCPVVATTAAAVPETSGEGAVLVDPDRPDEFVRAVRRLRSEPGLRERLVAAGRANAARFTWDAAAAALTEVLADALAADQPGPRPGDRPGDRPSRSA